MKPKCARESLRELRLEFLPLRVRGGKTPQPARAGNRLPRAFRLHPPIGDGAEMRAGVDSLLGRVAEFSPLEPEEGETRAAAREGTAEHAQAAEKAAASQAAASGKKLVNQIVAASTAKSVRIGLARLDRMMNTVGELVINRTRMVGRVGELEKLVDTLSFSKERLQGKVAEFQEKYEFNRISPNRNATPWNPESAPKFLSSAAVGETSFWSEFSELEMDRYDDVNILSRSMAEISADVNEVLSQLEAFIGRVEGDIDEFTKLAHHLQDEITAARMVPIGTLYSRLSRAVRDAATSTGKHVELDLSGSETELDNNIIQQISDPLVHLVRSE